MQSCVYTGWVRHRRSAPTAHAFRHRLFMMFLDLAELPALFDRYWLWSARRAAPAWFRREDYLGPAAVPLDVAVRDAVERQTGRRPRGPIRVLTHLRYFGYAFNPVTFYYCYDGDDRRVDGVVAEITNTPWGQRHAYAFAASEQGSAERLRFRFGKAFHVSPFLPMDMDYDWRFTPPGRRLVVHMRNERAGVGVFDATLHLKRLPLTGTTLARVLARHPFMSATVSAAIYWQAARLWLKRTPFYIHPDKADASAPRRT